MWKVSYCVTFILLSQPMGYFLVFSEDQWVWLAASLVFVAFAGLGPTIHDFRWQTGDAWFFFKRLAVGAFGIYGVTLFHIFAMKPLLKIPL